MRYLLCLLFLFSMACQSPKKKASLYETVKGNWLLLYLSTDDEEERQTEIYNKLQDSLVTGKGLKLISFYPDGGFAQLDSLPLTGRWSTKEDDILYVNDAGKGFEHFKGVFRSYEDGNMVLTEMIEDEGDKLELKWHLLRIDKGDATYLFEEKANAWRTIPVKEESTAEIKARLVSMLKYYGTYFKLLSEKSSYFIPARMMLPFKLYQHAIGIRYFDEKSRFARLFYSIAQAKIAHAMLDGLIERVNFSIDKKDSYTEEYSLMLFQLAEELDKSQL